MNLQSVEDALKEDIIEEATVEEDDLKAQRAAQHEERKENVVSHEDNVRHGVLSLSTVRHPQDNVHDSKGSKATCEDEVKELRYLITLVHHLF